MRLKVLLKRKWPVLAVIVLALILAVLSTLLTGCARAVPPAEDGKLKIVATTTMLHDLVIEIGGEQVDVAVLMGPGIDPHLYQASAGDVTKMQNASIVVHNGLHLEGKMGDVFAALSEQGRDIICIEDGLDTSMLLADADNPPVYDPHIWFDVAIWKDAARHVAAQLSAMDSENAASYAANLESYLEQLDTLDQYIHDRVAELPASKRVLVTAHDAFCYFGNAYGFEVMGLQGISTDLDA